MKGNAVWHNFETTYCHVAGSMVSEDFNVIFAIKTSSICIISIQIKFHGKPQVHVYWSDDCHADAVQL